MVSLYMNILNEILQPASTIPLSYKYLHAFTYYGSKGTIRLHSKDPLQRKNIPKCTSDITPLSPNGLL